MNKIAQYKRKYKALLLKLFSAWWIERQQEIIIAQQQRLLLTQKRHSRHRIRVVFLVHLPEFWYALKPVYARMVQDPVFEPIILRIPADILECGNFKNKSCEYLNQNLTATPQKIIEFKNINDIPANIMDIINPELIFKQVPWDGQYPEIFRTQNLLGFRLCYIPYVIPSGAKDKLLYDGDLYHYAWRLYCVNDYHRQCYAKYNRLSDINTVVSGFTKLEYLQAELGQPASQAWPLATKEPPHLKILWTPHHSLGNWLGFSTFPQNHLKVLDFALRNPQVQIVFRPHPALFDSMLTNKVMTLTDIDKFKQDFSQLENCYIDEDPEYVYLFQHADVLLTDGVGFLFEYLLTGKPIIHADSKVHCGFNEYYQQIEPAWYKAYSFNDVENTLTQLLLHQDPLAAKRQELVKLLYFDQNKLPSEIICADIRQALLS